VPFNFEDQDMSQANLSGTFTWNETTSQTFTRSTVNYSSISSGCTTVVTDGFIGLGEHESPQVSLWPNPADERIYIRETSNLKIKSITVFDLTGRAIHQIPNIQNGSEIELDISRFEYSGMAIIEIHFDNGLNSSVRVVIE
jgi:hypothetical protein